MIANGAAGTLIAPGNGEATYLFDNSENNSPAYIGYGPTSAIAVANAVVVPLNGVGPSQCLVVGKTTVQQFTLAKAQFFCAINALGSGVVRAMGGYGA